MKALKKYLKKRRVAINFLLEKPAQSYSPSTFHKLRIEIKKLDALFELLDFCSKNFKRRKNFKPFKLIFRQAGKVRELQVEEAMLKKYFPADFLAGYRANLKEVRLKERQIFFSMVNRKFTARLKKNFRVITPFATEANKKKVNSYLENKRRKIKKLLGQSRLQPEHLHALRKELKTFLYIRQGLNLKIRDNRFSKKDVLPGLVGEWHDCQVILMNLKNALRSGKINPKEMSQLEKVRLKFSSDSKEVFNKIREAIPASEFFQR
jgi:CHAD domain-containing protein